MTKEEAAQWHASIAACAGMLAGSIARGYRSRRLVQDCLSLLRPTIKAMEIDELTYAAEEKQAKKPQRQQRRR